MSRRTKNSLASLWLMFNDLFWNHPPQMKIKTTKKEDFEVEKSEFENEIGKQDNISTNNKIMPKLITHVSDISTEDHRKAKHSTCDECKNNKRQITAIKAMICDIQTSEMKDDKNAILKEIESVATIKSLRDENNEMASEIALLRSTISEVITDNETMRKIFDLKQNEWATVEGKPSKPKVITPETTSPTASTVNRFETPIDENSEHLSNSKTNDNLTAQILDYRLKQKSKFKNRKNRKQNQSRNQPNVDDSKKTQTGKRITESKKVLVIGDSMVKHIDRQKIERAAGCQLAVHSYSGALVEQVNKKINEYWSENYKYVAIILHVCQITL